MTKINEATDEVQHGIEDFEANLLKQGIKPHIDSDDEGLLTTGNVGKGYTRKEKPWEEYPVGYQEQQWKNWEKRRWKLIHD